MSIAELFDSAERKSKKGAFRNLVMMARSDGHISPEEQAMMDRMGRWLGLTDVQVKEITENPEAYPLFPPTSIQDRRERMVDLVRMMLADGEIDAQEMNMLTRLAVGLGYEEEEIPKFTHRIIHYVNEGLDREEVIEAMLRSKG